MAKKTTEKGLGWRHQQAVEYLLQRHKDGSPCDVCRRPMYLDPKLNYDYDYENPLKRGNGKLQGDHSKMSRAEARRRGEKVLPPDRLLHGECNRLRGEGLNDDLLAGVVAKHQGDIPLDAPHRMPWPFLQ